MITDLNNLAVRCNLWRYALPKFDEVLFASKEGRFMEIVKRVYGESAGGGLDFVLISNEKIKEIIGFLDEKCALLKYLKYNQIYQNYLKIILTSIDLDREKILGKFHGFFTDEVEAKLVGGMSKILKEKWGEISGFELMAEMNKMFFALLGEQFIDFGQEDFVNLIQLDIDGYNLSTYWRFTQIFGQDKDYRKFLYNHTGNIKSQEISIDGIREIMGEEGISDLAQIEKVVLKRKNSFLKKMSLAANSEIEILFYINTLQVITFNLSILAQIEFWNGNKELEKQLIEY